MRGARGKRGRPPKFGRPSQMVALTLPEEVVRDCGRIDDDIAWAIRARIRRERRRLRCHAGNRTPSW